MSQTAWERLAGLLGDAEGTGAFSAQRLAPGGLPSAGRGGAERIELLVPEEQARQLCELARPTRCGGGEQTLADTEVRDTWEIPPDLVSITGSEWAALFRTVLDGMRTELGCRPAASRARAAGASGSRDEPGVAGHVRDTLGRRKVTLMTDPVTLAIASAIAGKTAEALTEQAKQTVQAIVHRIREKLNGHAVELATLEAAQQDAAHIPELAAVLSRTFAEDPDFSRGICTLWNNVTITATQGNVTNVFDGTADKIIQMRDVHGDITIN
jgi:hypothetical protein